MPLDLAKIVTTFWHFKTAIGSGVFHTRVDAERTQRGVPEWQTLTLREPACSKRTKAFRFRTEVVYSMRMCGQAFTALLFSAKYCRYR